MSGSANDPDTGSGFYAALPAFARFADVADASRYRPLPGDWWIGVTDVVGSTRAIAAGRYKSVNLAGASAISAVMNALHGASFPFVFGGDGATLAVWPDARDAVEDALARTVRWCAEDLGLELRAALVPVRDIRAARPRCRRRPLPGGASGLLRNAGGRWCCLGDLGDEGRPLRGDTGTARRAARPRGPVVPSFMRDDHLHFVDGADGGHTRAALAIKALHPSSG